MYPQEGRVARDVVTTPQEARQPQVHRAIDELAKSTACLAETIDGLEKRLSAVLMQVPTGEKGNPTPKQVVVPLAESITSQADIIYSLHRRLDEILSRLEL